MDVKLKLLFLARKQNITTSIILLQTIMSTSVFVTGANGFIAQHLIKLLLSKDYKVVGTVRSAAKGDHLKNLLASENFSYEVVPDIVATGAFDKALGSHPEVSIFLHTASPFTFKVANVERDLLEPAVEGTKNVLSAIKTHGPQIKKVVVTSSVVAMIDVSRLKDPTYTVSEESWSPLTWEESKSNPIFGYFGSKKFAEKAAWDFVKAEKPLYSINFVNPLYVFGPQAFDSEVKDELNVSSEIINNLLKLNPNSEVPDQDGAFVDVRDVAKAHVAAFEKDFSNERLLLISLGFTAQALLDILNGAFESLKGKLPVGNPGNYLNGPPISTLDNKKTNELLGFPLIDLQTSVVESVSQILKAKQA